MILNTTQHAAAQFAVARANDQEPIFARIVREDENFVLDAIAEYVDRNAEHNIELPFIFNVQADVFDTSFYVEPHSNLSDLLDAIRHGIIEAVEDFSMKMGDVEGGDFLSKDVADCMLQATFSNY